MSDTGSALERLLHATARTISGGGLHPLVVLQDVEDACLAGAQDNLMPNQLTVSFNGADHARYEPGFAELRQAIEQAMDRIERARGYERLGSRSLDFTLSPSVVEGTVSVIARFADLEGRAAAPAPPPRGSTQRIERQGHLMLMVGDHTGVRLTHLPFTIGRGPGNDLVLASLSVSRNHARVLKNGLDYVIEDLGSRNGVVVDGKRQMRAIITPGQRVKVGDIEVWVEEENV